MTQDPQTRRQYLQRTGGVVLTAVGSAGLVATNSASASNGQQGALVDGFGDVEFDVRSFMSGYVSRYSGGYGSPDDVMDLADRARNEFNANTTAWVDYGNWLIDDQGLSASGNVTVGVDVAITRYRWPTRSESIETAVNVSYDDSTDEFTDLEWVAEPAENSDFEITIQDSAAENAADELTEFRREFIDETDGDHAIPDDEWLNELGGKYAGSIGMGPDAQSVLELLLGEVNVDGF